MTSLNDIRTTFLDFFKARGHEVVASSSLVPQNDPTLLFTNAGMVQFKNVFTGAETRDRVRAATSQKCVRAGGKHNDLDNVGHTARHHTFFEMLGNFSFGDYFKEEAISYAWELVTKDFAIPKDRLIVTIFNEDDEAFNLWRKIAGLPDNKIIRIAASDNFWSMGKTGPCGPCSEIFYDHGDHVPGGPPGSSDADGDRFIEIWNLVFMQYDQIAEDERVALPRPSIDTGMGLERTAALLQGTHDNYKTDLFRHLIQASAEASRVAPDGARAISHRVIADHLRSCSFLMADGVLPSNEGRGYVLRRIMRRAMRHAHILGTDDPLLWRLVPVLISEMGAAYPELGRAQALIEETFKLEEERFRQMLARGLRLLDEAAADLEKGGELPGEIAFKLYDTYGFPLDLTQDALRARNIKIDTAGFDKAMQRQRAEARKAWRGSGDAAAEEVWFDIRDKEGATEFLGYEADAASGIVIAIEADGKLVEEIVSGREARVVANQTPFYGESGGQIGDTGTMFTASGAEFVVTGTHKKLSDLIVHEGRLDRGALRIGDTVELRVDAERRNKIRANHSATHLLHATLRDILGPHVTQKGSMVSQDRLRFDFSQTRAVTVEELREIEERVNAVVLQNEDVSIRLMTPGDAIEAGALALFGEKYGDEVRVLMMGTACGGRQDQPYSIELCGGTHVRRLGDIGLFKIVQESAIAAGVRRIEALTGEAARRYLEDQVRLGLSAAAELKTSLTELPGRIATLLDDRKKLEHELSELKKKLALSGTASSAGDDILEVKGVRVFRKTLSGVSSKDLRSLIDEGKNRIGSGVVAFVSVIDGKAALAVGVTDDLTSKLDAVKLVRAGAQAVGGSGGGRPDMAQAGGPNADKAQEALERIEFEVEASVG